LREQPAQSEARPVPELAVAVASANPSGLAIVYCCAMPWAHARPGGAASGASKALLCRELVVWGAVAKGPGFVGPEVWKDRYFQCATAYYETLGCM
jgi:hypothetical protein